MIRRSLLALAVLVGVAGAQTPAPAAAARQPDLRTLIDAANADPAQVVPLLERCSAYVAALSPAEARKLGDQLEPFAHRVFFSSERLPGRERVGVETYVVAKGDTPTSIAARHGVAPKMLQLENEGFDPKRLRVGQTLEVLDAAGSIDVEVDRTLYRVRVWKRLPTGRVLVMYAPCGLGAQDSPTPIGSTRIAKRVLDPQWTDPDTKQTFAAGDPRNVLGGYWMALDPDGIGRSGIGFHGFTGAPPADWIQRPASHGCVRMLQGDIDRLFQVALEGTPVTLR